MITTNFDTMVDVLIGRYCVAIGRIEIVAVPNGLILPKASLVPRPAEVLALRRHALLAHHFPPRSARGTPVVSPASGRDRRPRKHLL